MILALSLCFLSSFFYNYQNIDITIDIPKEIQNREVVVLSGTIYNGSANNIAFWDIQLFESLYRGDTHWEIIILKERQQFFIPMVVFGKRIPPKVINPHYSSRA